MGNWFSGCLFKNFILSSWRQKCIYLNLQVNLIHHFYKKLKKGQIKIPQFQRNFVWSVSDSAKLMDSIIKGYPIGTFIFWRTKEQLRSVRNLGNITLPNSEDGEYVDYVLDGQQRLTSLFALFAW